MSPDFKDLLSAFNAHRVDCLVVGAHALAAHGYVRATGDLDVWCGQVLTSIDGVQFEDAWNARLTARFLDLPVPVLSAKHLIQNKRTVARPQDLAGVDWLEKNRKA